MTQEAYPLSPSFVTTVAANVIRMRQEGHGGFYISKVLKQVAKNHVGKEREYLLMQAKRAVKKELQTEGIETAKRYIKNNKAKKLKNKG